jgi:hypothetical protein
MDDGVGVGGHGFESRPGFNFFICQKLNIFHLNLSKIKFQFIKRKLNIKKKRKTDKIKLKMCSFRFKCLG